MLRHTCIQIIGSHREYMVYVHPTVCICYVYGCMCDCLVCLLVSLCTLHVERISCDNACSVVWAAPCDELCDVHFKRMNECERW